MKSTNELTANVSDVTPKPKKVATGLSGKTKYRLETAFWWILSISIFVGIWELCWYVGWADPLLMPPPHIFLSDLPETFKFFDRGNIIGSDQTGASLLGVLSVLLWTTMMRRIEVPHLGQAWPWRRNTRSPSWFLPRLPPTL